MKKAMIALAAAGALALSGCGDTTTGEEDIRDDEIIIPGEEGDDTINP